MRKKYYGEWHNVVETLLPRYLFVENNNDEKVTAIRNAHKDLIHSGGGHSG